MLLKNVALHFRYAGGWREAAQHATVSWLRASSYASAAATVRVREKCRCRAVVTAAAPRLRNVRLSVASYRLLRRGDVWR